MRNLAPVNACGGMLAEVQSGRGCPGTARPAPPQSKRLQSKRLQSKQAQSNTAAKARLAQCWCRSGIIPVSSSTCSSNTGLRVEGVHRPARRTSEPGFRMVGQQHTSTCADIDCLLPVATAGCVGCSLWVLLMLPVPATQTSKHTKHP